MGSGKLDQARHTIQSSKSKELTYSQAALFSHSLEQSSSFGAWKPSPRSCLVKSPPRISISSSTHPKSDREGSRVSQLMAYPQ